VLISSYLLRITTMWRQATITAALVIATGLARESTAAGFQAALLKVAQVLFGCLVGIGVSWLISRAWPLLETSEPSVPVTPARG